MCFAASHIQGFLHQCFNTALEGSKASKSHLFLLICQFFICNVALILANIVELWKEMIVIRNIYISSEEQKQ